jgi:hypothetical protein
MSGISPYSNVHNWNFNLSAPCLPEPFYPEQNQNDNLDGFWTNLSGTLPSTFLPEEEFNARFLNLPAGSQTANIPLPTTIVPAVDVRLTHNLPHAPINNNNRTPPLVLERQQPVISSHSNLNHGNFNLSAPRLPESMPGENTQKAHMESLLEKFIEALSRPPQFALEAEFKAYFLDLTRKLQSQVRNDPFLKPLFDKVVQILEHPNMFVSSVFSQPIHLGTDRCPMELTGISPRMELANAAPKYFNKTVQDLLLILLAECFHTNEGRLFEALVNVHEKLGYPKVVYKSTANNNSIVKILHMDIIQLTLFHNKISLLHLVKFPDIAFYLTRPLTYQLICESQPKFTFLADKNIKLAPIEQSFFYKIFNEPSGLENFFKTTPFEVIEELADYLLVLLLRGYTSEYKKQRRQEQYTPFQDLDIIRNFLSKIINLSIKFSLTEFEKSNLLSFSQENSLMPQTILDQFPIKHLPSRPRIKKYLADDQKDEVSIWEKFQNVLLQKPYSVFVQGHDLYNEELNWVVSTSLFEKNPSATVLLQFLNLKKSSLIVQKMTAGFIRQFDSSFHLELPGNAEFDTNLILEPRYFDPIHAFVIPPEVVKRHVAFILEFYTSPNILFTYLNFLGSNLSSEQSLMILNFKFKFEFSHERHRPYVINSSIISLLYPILLNDNPSWNNFSRNSGLGVSFCHQTLIPKAHWVRQGENTRITGAPFIPHIIYLLNTQEHLLVQMYQKLAEDFLKVWCLPEYNELFVNALASGKGIWGFDLNPKNHLKLLRQPLEASLATCTEGDRRIISAIVEDIAEFFDFFDSSKYSSNDNELTSLLSRYPHTVSQDEPLGTHESLQAAQAFFDLKINEFKGQIEHFKYSFFKKTRIRLHYSIPCYLVAQDLQSFYVRIMKAHFDNVNSLVQLSPPTEAERHFLQTIAPHAEILKTVAQITLEDLKNLHKTILTAKGPCALILRRPQAVDSITGNKKRKREDSNQEIQPRVANPPGPLSLPPQTPPLPSPKYSFGIEEFWKLQSLISLDALESDVQ